MVVFYRPAAGGFEEGLSVLCCFVGGVVGGNNGDGGGKYVAAYCFVYVHRNDEV